MGHIVHFEIVRRIDKEVFSRKQLFANFDFENQPFHLSQQQVSPSPLDIVIFDRIIGLRSA